ncbi:MAG: hypothetical protein MK066_03125 [Crocinitomicaceae bacterium]|nr:hypothetical protein [Crocinitomicaceae bacterium]
MTNEKIVSLGITIGVVLGTTVGVITNHLLFWLSTGVIIGSAIGTSLMKHRKGKRDNNSTK